MRLRGGLSQLTWRKKVRWFLQVLVSAGVLATASWSGLVNAQCPSPGGICATPGQDGNGGTLTGVVNAYYPGSANAGAGATTITVGAASGAGAAKAIAAGNLLLVIQMQGADIHSTNTNNYGADTGTGSGYLNNGDLTAGLYEFVTVTTGVSTAGGTITIKGGGTGTGLINSYVNAAFGTNGQRTFQVVRVPQYTEAALSSGLTAAPWNGATGGVLAIDVNDRLNLNSATVAVDGLGFRPGAGQILQGAGTATNNLDYVNVTTNNFHGNKGEGIAGTPWYCVNNDGTVTNNGVEGYPNGSRARGAPGNAGGGGTDPDSTANDQNCGGGGGGNGGAGGEGGLSWFTQIVDGGLGGAAFAQASACRIIMGGGGGSGDMNNDQGVTDAGNGSAGGGIIIIRTRFVDGTGTITANGAAAFNGTQNDGGGGGGAGGTIIVSALTSNLSGLTVQANGGSGGDTWSTTGINDTAADQTDNQHGPGGGGGGGVVYLSSAAASISVAGGAHGTTTTSATAFGSVSGSAGTSTTTLLAASIPGVYSGAQCSTTAVTFESFKAEGHGKRVLLKWRTGFEIDNLGFNLYRDENGQPVRINPSLIGGSALIARAGTALTAGWQYKWWDTPAGGPSSQYWLEDIDVHGEKKMRGPISVDPASDDTSEAEPAESLMLRELGHDQLEPGRFSGPLEEKSDPPSEAAKLRPDAIAKRALLAGVPAVKISIQNSGWYQITEQQLVAAGFDATAPSSLQLFLNGVEVPIVVSGASSAYTVQFYGLGPNTPYTPYNVYWLVWGLQTGHRVPTLQSAGFSSGPTTFPYTAQLLERSVYFPGALTAGDEDFFGDPVTADSPTDEFVQVNGLNTGATGSATLQVAVEGVTSLPHRVLLSLNGTPVGEIDFTGITGGVTTIPIPSSLVKPGPNDITLISADGESDVSLLNYINITYPHTYTATGNVLPFTAQGGQRIALGGFTNANIRVMDVTNPNSVSQVAATVQETGATFTASFSDPEPGARTLFAFTSDQAQVPAALSLHQPSNWGQPGHGADLVIITNSNFISSLAPLVALRQSQGLRVSVIDVGDLYAEFNFGQKDPQAIKSFLQYTQTGWNPAPRFVLMAGKATYDPNNYLGFGDWDLVPTKLINTALMQAASDDWLVDFNNTGFPDLAIGRLPAKTVQDMTLMVSKVLSYDNTAARGGALLVSDISDDFNFLNSVQQLAPMLPASVPPTIIDRGSNPNAETVLLNGINQGQKLVDYAGHGSVDIWRGNLLTDSSALTLTNGQSLPFFVIMTCLNGAFDDPSLDSLAESLLKAPQGGAAVIWASSALTQPGAQPQLNDALFASLFSSAPQGGNPSGTLTIGQATAKAKAKVFDIDVRRTWILFGDPAAHFKQ
jgi:hypothetical protein